MITKTGEKGKEDDEMKKALTRDRVRAYTEFETSYGVGAEGNLKSTLLGRGGLGVEPIDLGLGGFGVDPMDRVSMRVELVAKEIKMFVATTAINVTPIDRSLRRFRVDGAIRRIG